MLRALGTRGSVAALATVVLLTTAACSGGGSEGSGDGGDGPVTLNLSTFGDFGYSDEMIARFEAEYPDIKVVHNIAADSDEARSALFTGLAAKSGLADVEALEIDWTVDLAQYADLFYPVPTDDEYGDWVDFAKAPVTTDDGSLFAYSVATGPSAICYRSDLLKAAGLPTDPAEVAALLEGDWAHYFEVGQEYKAGGGEVPWFDSASGMYRSWIQQMANPYEEDDDTIVATTNPEVEAAFRETLAAAPDLSAGLAPFSDDWFSAMNSGQFATMACPSWMLGVIEGAAPDVTTWEVANVFPNGGGNSGGSYLTVPKQTEHPKEAALLASWLTAPEQQIEAFQAAGPFPSRLDAFESPELQDITSPYFQDAPSGKIFTERSETITEVAYKGPNFFTIDNAAADAFTRVESGDQTVDEAWDQFVSEVEGLE